MEVNKIESIYKIINNETERFYVGRSNNVTQRLKRHKSLLERDIHENVYLQRAWHKYNGNFRTEIVCEIDTGDFERDRELAIQKEQEILDEHVMGKDIYNMSPSALTGVRYGEDHHAYGKTPKEFMGEEGYRKYLLGLSESRKGSKNPFYGKKHTEEVLEILREKCALYGEDNGFYGKSHTKESKELMRKKAKRKSVVVKGIEYDSIWEAHRETGHGRTTIKTWAESTEEKHKDCYFVGSD